MQPSIGEQLKSARETRGASIEQASQATHIRPHLIVALENEDYSAIPSIAQTKGFIRLYANWLQLDPTKILTLYERLQYPNSLEEPTVELSNSTSSKPEIIEELSDSQISEKDTPNRRNDPELSEVVEKDNFIPEEGITIDSDAALNPTSSNELFLKIGKQLRECRENLQISFDDVEKLTHIRSRYLADMEMGDFSDIPSLVQARGLLSGYAKFLNLDYDEILSLYAEALQQRRIELLPPDPEKSTTNKAVKEVSTRPWISKFLSIDMLTGIVVIAGLVGFGIWGAAQVMSSNNNSPVETAPPISDILRQNPTIESNLVVTSTISATELVRNPDLVGQLPVQDQNTDNGQPDTAQTPLVPNLGESSMQVYIVPNQRVFLQVTVGKSVVFNGRTIPGNAYPFTSDERIEVVSGNAAALQIYYNQRDLGTLGLAGEPLRMIFSKEGITTPTPINTALPTQTQIPTLTLRPTATPPPPTVTPLIP